jgi:hypothetical protein
VDAFWGAAFVSSGKEYRKLDLEASADGEPVARFFGNPVSPAPRADENSRTRKGLRRLWTLGPELSEKEKFFENSIQ